MEGVGLPASLVRSTELHDFVTFSAFLDIFCMSNVTFGLEVFDILDILKELVASNSPPSLVAVVLGLWAALGVGASYR